MGSWCYKLLNQQRHTLISSIIHLPIFSQLIFTYKSVQVVFIQKVEVLSQSLEHFMHVLPSLSRSFDIVGKLLISSECKRLFMWDFPWLFHVWEIPNQIDDDRGSCMIADLPEPLILNVFKTGALRDIKDKEDSIAALVEVPRDWTERLLTSCIPNLQLDIGLFADNHTKIPELNSNGDSVLLFKSLACKSFENAGLADACVAEDDNLEEDIEVVHHARKVRVILNRHSRRQIVDLRIQWRVQSIHDFFYLNYN